MLSQDKQKLCTSVVVVGVVLTPNLQSFVNFHKKIDSWRK